jgi:hypothetical protein
MGGTLLVALLVALTALAGTARASSLPTLTLAVSPSAIAVSGATQSGAVNVVATDTGVKEGSAILFALKPGVNAAEVYAYLESKGGKDPNAASKYGSIVFDEEAERGVTSEAQTSLQPGQYLAIVIEGEGKAKAHTAFTVTAAPSPAALPTPEATIRSIEFGFRGPSTLHDGELVRFENEGWLVHMDFAVPVKNKAAAGKLLKDLLANNEKAAGKLFAGPPVGFAGPLSTGGFQQETITARPGYYVQLCFMDTQDGRSHTQLGMERVIKIVK